MGRSGFHVDLTMPRFEFRSQFGLVPVLEDLGMEAAFVAPPGEGSADLTGIVEARELYVQDVIHQGFVKVDERGTEAAAATAIVAIGNLGSRARHLDTRPPLPLPNPAPIERRGPFCRNRGRPLCMNAGAGGSPAN